MSSNAMLVLATVLAVLTATLVVTEVSVGVIGVSVGGIVALVAVPEAVLAEDILAAVSGASVLCKPTLYLLGVNKMKKYLAMILMAASPVAASLAQNIPTSGVTTEAMIELCKSRTDIEAQTFCYGFGEGVYQGYLLGRNTKEAPTICLPPQGVSRDAVLAEFIKWAMERPQYNQDKAAVTIMRFLPVRFPC
jgi:hypothetical protein